MELDARIVTLRMAETFVISRGAADEAEVVLVELTHEGVTGYGEATPIDLETVASVQDNIIGNCLCVLGDSMAMPVGAMVKKFREEFMDAIEHGVPGATLGAPSGDPAIAAAGQQPMPARVGVA